MLSDEVIDMLSERLVERIQEGNIYVLKKIGNAIKEIGTLNPTQAQQLAQILKYGGSYQEIVYKLSQITGLNAKEIEKIFQEVALQNVEFAKQFYDYRGIDFIPYKNNVSLQKQVRAIANRAIYDYMNMARTSALGIVRTNELGEKSFVPLQKAYFDIIDEAVLSVGQGKDTFDNQMYKIIKEVGSGGLKVQYESGAVRRLDSAVRMNLKEGLRNMSNELQYQFGEEFGADGVEISAHANPAKDHELLQGRQFSNDEYDKLNAGVEAKTYDKIIIPADDRRRPISTLNCYHYIFRIVLGVSEPNYSKEELQKILDDNDKGFELDGKHYTLYDGTQMQRRLETEIRKQKDIQIMGVASGNKKAVDEAQKKISQLTMKYKELSEKSGLPTRMERMRVSGYRRRNVNKRQVSKLQQFRNMTPDELSNVGNLLLQNITSEKLWEEGLNGISDTQRLVYGLGLNAKPTVLSVKEFEKASEGHTLIYRGVKPIQRLSAEGIIDNLKYSDKTYIGSGINSDGIYFSTKLSRASHYAGDNGAIATAYIDLNKVKAIDELKLEEMHEEFLSKHSNIGRYSIMGDLSNFAIYKGYNCITIGGVTEKYYNVLDRSILVIRE